MTRIRTKNPPPPIGQTTLTIYDQATWEDAQEDAAGWQIDLGLYVEYALRKYHQAKLSKMRLARWRHEQDLKDPDLCRIREFLGGEEKEPEYMREKYLPKSRRRERGR